MSKGPAVGVDKVFVQSDAEARLLRDSDRAVFGDGKPFPRSVPAQRGAAGRVFQQLFVGVVGEEVQVGGDGDVGLVAVRDDPLTTL